LKSLATSEFVSIVALNDNACSDFGFREVRSFWRRESAESTRFCKVQAVPGSLEMLSLRKRWMERSREITSG